MRLLCLVLLLSMLLGFGSKKHGSLQLTAFGLCCGCGCGLVSRHFSYSPLSRDREAARRLEPAERERNILLQYRTGRPAGSGHSLSIVSGDRQTVISEQKSVRTTYVEAVGTDRL